MSLAFLLKEHELGVIIPDVEFCFYNFSSMQEIKYTHDEIHHNLTAPSIIVPYLIESIRPKSVVDVGCGIGTFLHVFFKMV